MKRINTPHWETADGSTFDDKEDAMLHEAKLDLAGLLDALPDAGIDAANAVLLDSEEWMRVISLMRRRAKQC